jgi:hypothetical protein
MCLKPSRCHARRFLATAVFGAIAVVVAACDGPETPTAPTPAPTLSVSPLNIAGTVRDLLQQPIEDARVEIADGPLVGLSTVTDGGGQYSLSSASPSPDLVKLVVSKEGYAPATETVRNGSLRMFFLKHVGFAELAGSASMTFVADASCAELPPALRRRSYDARIEETASSPWVMTVKLSGAGLAAGYDTLSMGASREAVRFHVFSWQAFMWWLEDQPIIERVAPTEHLALSGSAGAPFTNGQRTIAATFDGTFSYCSESKPPANPQFPFWPALWNQLPVCRRVIN